jgi:hypothetical protein
VDDTPATGTHAIRTEVRTVPAGGIPLFADADPAQAAVDRLPEGRELSVLGRRGTWVHVETADGVEGWVDGAQLVGASRTPSEIGSVPEGGAGVAPRSRVVEKEPGSFSLGRGPLVGAVGALFAIFGTALPWQQTIASRVEVDAFGLPVRVLTGWQHLGDHGFALGWLVVILAGIGAVVSIVAGGGIVRRILGFAIVLVCIVYVLQQQDWLSSIDKGVGTGLNVWDVVDYGVLVTFGGGLLMTLAPSR